jgi:anti-sigma factor RsiW
MTHPDMAALALYAGGDLPVLRRLAVRLHLARCASCRREAEAFRRQGEELREECLSLPEGIGWSALAAEMKANIQLGLAAGECVTPPAAAPRRLSWRAAAALASITLVVVSGWWIPRWRHPSHRPVDGIVATATADGVEVQEESWALALTHASAGPVMVSADAEGSLAARYVDDETGMVTIHNVYVQ